jgi:hypothetical protein
VGRFFWIIWTPLYVVLIVAVVAGLWYARREALAIYTTPAARAEWQKWVAEAQRQERGEGPVRRRAPRTDQPPAAILMRDYFLTCLAAALLLVTALFWSLAFMMHGAFLVRPRAESNGSRIPSATVD